MHFDSAWQRNTFLDIGRSLIKLFAEICNVNIPLKIEQVIYYDHALKFLMHCTCIYVLYSLFLSPKHYILSNSELRKSTSFILRMIINKIYENPKNDIEFSQRKNHLRKCILLINFAIRIF